MVNFEKISTHATPKQQNVRNTIVPFVQNWGNLLLVICCSDPEYYLIVIQFISLLVQLYPFGSLRQTQRTDLPTHPSKVDQPNVRFVPIHNLQINHALNLDGLTAGKEDLINKPTC